MAVEITYQAIADFEKAEQAAREFREKLVKEYAEGTERSAKEVEKLVARAQKAFEQQQGAAAKAAAEIEKANKRLSSQDLIGALGDLRDVFEKVGENLLGLSDASVEAASNVGYVAEKGAMLGLVFGGPVGAAIGGVAGLLLGALSEGLKTADDGFQAAIDKAEELQIAFRSVDGATLPQLKAGLIDLRKQLLDSESKARETEQRLRELNALGLLKPRGEVALLGKELEEDRKKAEELRKKVEELDRLSLESLQKSVDGIRKSFEDTATAVSKIFTADAIFSVEQASEIYNAATERQIALAGELKEAEGRLAEGGAFRAEREKEVLDLKEKVAKANAEVEESARLLAAADKKRRDDEEKAAEEKKKAGEKAADARKKAAEDEAKLQEKIFLAKQNEERADLLARIELENQAAEERLQAEIEAAREEYEIRQRNDALFKQSLDARLQAEMEFYEARKTAMDHFSAEWESRLQPFADVATGVFNQIGSNIEESQKLFFGLGTAAASALSSVFKQLGKKAFGEGLSFSADAIAAFFNPILGGPAGASAFATAAAGKFATAAFFGAGGALAGRAANRGGASSSRPSAGGGSGASPSLGRSASAPPTPAPNITIQIGFMAPGTEAEYDRAARAMVTALERHAARGGRMSSLLFRGF